MKANESTLQELLGGQKQYLVPLYQRTYSWGPRQFAQLWSDIVELAEDFSRGRSLTHFMGSLVLAPSPSLSPAGVQEWLIVDGQQRLTTISVLLCALRDHLALSDRQQRDRIDELFLVNKWSQGQTRYKLLPTQSDRSAYMSCVDGRQDAGHGEGIGTAYRWFRGKLADSQEPLDFGLVEQAVTTGLSLVVISAQSGDNVHRIFESLNNTGVRLTQGDLLRNYFFMRLSESAETVYHSLWRPMEELLSPDELELLLWLDLVIRGDVRAKRTEIYRSQQERLDRIDGAAGLTLELEEIARRAVHLKTILEPARETDPTLRRRLDRLAAWGSQTTFPLTMHLLDARDRNELTTADAAESLLYVESFLVRRMLVGRSTNNLNRVLTSAVAEMPADLPVPEAVRAYLSGSRKYWATDQQLRASIRQHNFYWTGRAAQRSLVLSWIEESYGRKERVDPATLTIEHVLPQTLTDEWRAVLESDKQSEETAEELHRTLVHTLGNLTLTGYNSELSNRTFEEKRDELRRSGLALNQKIADQQRWGRAEIESRADDLAEIIISEWPGPEKGHDVDDPPVWQQLEQIVSTLPYGAWTSYGDIAEVIGSHAVPVGVRIATHPVVGGHRVLTVQGTVSAQFRWYEEGRTDDPIAVLESEGIAFDASGRAHPSQRYLAKDLADLIGLERADSGVAAEVSGDGVERAQRFDAQLREHQLAAVANGVQNFITTWLTLGGEVEYGRASETSAILHFLPYRHRGYVLWVAVIYPSGTFEISFQHLKSKAPFTEPALREELRGLLNKAEGVQIPESKIGVRPSVSLTLFADERSRAGLVKAFSWLVNVARQHAPRVSDADEAVDVTLE